LALDLDSKARVKQEVLRTLGSPTGKAGVIAAQVVAAIASVELPINQWPEVIEVLLGFVNNPDNVHLRISALQAIGFICETIVSFAFRYQRTLLMECQKPEILSLRSNEILTAVIHGARKEEPSTDVQLAAINSLYNSLEFVRDNFEREVSCYSSRGLKHLRWL
jgi:importin subunit beta-1